MIFSKRIIVFIAAIIVLFLPSLMAITVTDITPTSVKPDAEPGWKGKIRITFTGEFNPEAYNYTTTSGSPGLEIQNVKIVSADHVTTTEYTVIAEMTVQTSFKLKRGKVPFTLSDDTGHRVKGFIRVNTFSGIITEISPMTAVAGSDQEYLLNVNMDFPAGSLMESIIYPPGCPIKSVSLEGTITIKLALEIGENTGGKNLSLYFRIGTDDEYQTFAGINLLPITFDSIKIEEVSPNHAIQGEKNVLLKIKGKSFVNGTEIKFSDPGIEVGPVKVVSPTTLETMINLSMKTKPGPVDIIVLRKKLHDTGSGMFKVIEAVKPVISMIEPNRVHAQRESIFLTIKGEGFDENTDFSISGRGITILGKNIIGPNEARLEILVLKTAEEGMRGISAFKPEGLKFNRPNSLFVEILKPFVENLTPNYAEINSSANKISVSGGNFEQGMKITFSSAAITLKQLNLQTDKAFNMIIDVGDRAAAGSETFFLSNPNQNPVAIPDKLRIIKKQYDYKIALVSPGVKCADIKDNPASGLDAAASNLKIRSLYPVFKWTSNAKNYNFDVYTEVTGQKEIGEIISNRPFYHQEGLTADNLTYPLKARELRQGKRYYWKVDAIFKDKTIQSEVWCFEIEETMNR
jgi:hypothetical protein